MISLSRLRSSISYDGVEHSPLPLRACLLRVAPMELVDFIFFSDFDLLKSWVRDRSFSCPRSSSRTSFRVRKLRISRAIFSRVVPRFLGEEGGRCGSSVAGHAGRGLTLLVRLQLLGMLLFRLPLLLLVDGRSIVAKLMPESERRSAR